jgi:hypothetical protein
MTAAETINDSQKFILYLSITGKRAKKDSEGSTSQKMLLENSCIFCTSFVSRNIQMIAMKDTSGTEASIPAMILLFFEISLIRTIRAAEITTLIA